ncbi:hypothetical protein SRRS_09540 [Sporomusa rhizae]|uniref:flagellar hook-associated protein FlgL n=1 Tax=Sporomusa rhizae TaxID=357999 RepID=UPI00352AD24D
MRITNSMITDNSVWNINKNMERLNDAQQKYTTQSKIQLPSDDPIVASRAVKYRSYVANIEQYQKNVNGAVSWEKVTDGAMDGLGNVIVRLKELVTKGSSSGTLTNSELQDIKAEVNELQQQAVDYLNTSYAGRYVFAGYDTDKPPYEIESTAVGNRIKFKGQYLSVGGAMAGTTADSDITSFCSAAYTNSKIYNSTAAAQDIQYNVGFGTSVPVNVEGQNVTGAGLDNLFDTFSKILIGLDGGTSYKTATVDSNPTPGSVHVTSTSFKLTDTLDELAANNNTILTARADLGARMNYTNMAKTRIDSDKATYTELMSNNEDTDLAESYTNVTTAQTVYNASLSVSSKVMGKSLVDYLR